MLDRALDRMFCRSIWPHGFRGVDSVRGLEFQLGFLSFKPAPRVSKVRCMKGFGVFLDLKLFWF